MILALVFGCGAGSEPRSLDPDPRADLGDPTSLALDPGPDTPCGPADQDTVADVITDIDGTLTTSDEEWSRQIHDPTYDPEMRPDANTLMQAWYARGYRVVYVTARSLDGALSDGTPAREATARWLVDHDFPVGEGRLHLSDDPDHTVTYKTGVLTDLERAGEVPAFAYGNADTDVEAYLAAGIPPHRVFLVGDLAGELGVVGLTDEEAYTGHLPFVRATRCGR